MSTSSTTMTTMLSFSTVPSGGGSTKTGATLLGRRRTQPEVNLTATAIHNVSTNSLTLRPLLLSAATATLRDHPCCTLHTCTSTSPIPFSFSRTTRSRARYAKRSAIRIRTSLPSTDESSREHPYPQCSRSRTRTCTRCSSPFASRP